MFGKAWQQQPVERVQTNRETRVVGWRLPGGVERADQGGSWSGWGPGTPVCGQVLW